MRYGNCFLALFLISFLASCSLQAVDPGPIVHRVVSLPPRGKVNAPVTIVQYSDFGCEHCKTGATTMREVLAKYPDDVRVFFRPVSFFKGSQGWIAAKAALAAGTQGKFWEMHDLLFSRQEVLSNQALSQFAIELKLDRRRFERDMRSTALDRQIEAESRQAQDLGLKGTPCFLINDKLVQGAFPASLFMAAVERLKSKKKEAEPLASGKRERETSHPL